MLVFSNFGDQARKKQESDRRTISNFKAAEEARKRFALKRKSIGTIQTATDLSKKRTSGAASAWKSKAGASKFDGLSDQQILDYFDTNRDATYNVKDQITLERLTNKRYQQSELKKDVRDQFLDAADTRKLRSSRVSAWKTKAQAGKANRELKAASEKLTVLAKEKPTVVAKPTIVTKPKPTIVAKPKPTVVTKPKPTVVAKPKPTVVAKPKPTVVAKPKPTVVTKPKPTVVTKPELQKRRAFAKRITAGVTFEQKTRKKARHRIVRRPIDRIKSVKSDIRYLIRL